MEIVIFVLIGLLIFTLKWVYQIRYNSNQIESFEEIENNQAQLNAYLSKKLTNVDIGIRYERQVGYLLESQGYDVEYYGAINGVEDLGRDLIVKKDKEVWIVQTKCWASHMIRAKHIYQLYGTMEHFRISQKLNHIHKAIFYTTSTYDQSSKDAAKALKVELRTLEQKQFPMIKCNINASGNKIYHLPFDEFYDKVKIKYSEGEFFAHTVAEAASKGFRRAKKYRKAS